MVQKLWFYTTKYVTIETGTVWRIVFYTNFELIITRGRREGG